MKDEKYLSTLLLITLYDTKHARALGDFVLQYMYEIPVLKLVVPLELAPFSYCLDIIIS